MRWRGQSSQGEWDAFLVEIHRNGEEIWKRQFGTAGFDTGWDVVASEDAIYTIGNGGQGEEGVFVQAHGIELSDDLYERGLGSDATGARETGLALVPLGAGGEIRAQSSLYDTDRRIGGVSISVSEAGSSSPGACSPRFQRMSTKVESPHATCDDGNAIADIVITNGSSSSQTYSWNYHEGVDDCDDEVDEDCDDDSEEESAEDAEEKSDEEGGAKAD